MTPALVNAALSKRTQWRGTIIERLWKNTLLSAMTPLLLVGIITFSIYREGGLDSGDDTKEGVPDDDDVAAE